jgi:hypothetical protein
MKKYDEQKGNEGIKEKNVASKNIMEGREKDCIVENM